MISMVVAMAENRAIGRNNELLWHLPDDFQHFKSLTMGKPILMGRKTYDSIGRVLPGRKNIVISRDNTLSITGAIVVNSIEAAMEVAKEDEEIMVIGGASFYQQMLPLADKLYVTLVHHSFQADAYFPEINKNEWCVLESIEHVADEKHAYNFSFITYQRHSACEHQSHSFV